jgi:segregation and condensation protein A
MTDPSQAYRIQLPQFEGPFDLLLFFIERDELDIHDIPISRITADFLGYLQQMQELNIEVAAEFILVAGTLMRIKARMLLPRPVLDASGQEVDPRRELVDRLLEYRRYKSVLEDLARLESDQDMREPRGNAVLEEQELQATAAPEDELTGIDLYSLMRAFKRIWDKHHEKLQKPRHVIQKYPYTLDSVKSRLMERLSLRERVDFISVAMEESSRIYVVFCFLAVLELVQMQKARLLLGEGFNQFWIELREPAAAPPADA